MTYGRTLLRTSQAGRGSPSPRRLTLLHERRRSPRRRPSLSQGTIPESARRPRADACFAQAEQASSEARPAHLVLVRGGRLGPSRRDDRFPRGRSRPRNVWHTSARRHTTLVARERGLYAASPYARILGVSHDLADELRGIASKSRRRAILERRPASRPRWGFASRPRLVTHGSPPPKVPATSGSAVRSSPLRRRRTDLQPALLGRRRCVRGFQRAPSRGTPSRVTHS